jgi:hypothetical protein
MASATAAGMTATTVATTMLCECWCNGEREGCKDCRRE